MPARFVTIHYPALQQPFQSPPDGKEAIAPVSKHAPGNRHAASFDQQVGVASRARRRGLIEHVGDGRSLEQQRRHAEGRNGRDQPCSDVPMAQLPHRFCHGLPMDLLEDSGRPAFEPAWRLEKQAGDAVIYDRFKQLISRAAIRRVAWPRRRFAAEHRCQEAAYPGRVRLRSAGTHAALLARSTARCKGPDEGPAPLTETALLVIGARR